MLEKFDSYESIRRWKDHHILDCRFFNQSLNVFHDKVMEQVFLIALKRLNLEEPPCDFAWFLIGSGGRYEQGLISDQDHGIVYEMDSTQSKDYFEKLGNELSYGLNIVGYPYCEGNVMPSNPLWCQSFSSWKQQLDRWMKEETWEAIRYLQIFYDARALQGNENFLTQLRLDMYNYRTNHPQLLQRFLENTMHIKNVIGPFGQFLVEEMGEQQGAIDLKHAAFIPYVNAIRLLAITEGLNETTTIGRIECLVKEKKYPEELYRYKDNFIKLITYRNNLFNEKYLYGDYHYINVQKLSKEEKRELKQIVKDGKKIHYYVRKLIEKRVLKNGV